jgi:hypothetical protein
MEGVIAGAQIRRHSPPYGEIIWGDSGVWRAFAPIEVYACVIPHQDGIAAKGWVSEILTSDFATLETDHLAREWLI